ncbi:uncharacterized protein LOC136752606 [Amia ocellicauda]|uniref:uncharacterized protein LOC136752606 n=1 Tax=Amia ocellicauda TaxID=2972642 RepID=UPI0034640832
MHTVRLSRWEQVCAQRVELAERKNKHAEDRLGRKVSAMDLDCSRQLAILHEQKRQLQQELCSIRYDTTPSLENLAMELPPELPKPYFSKKRLSLPTLQLAPSLPDAMTRRNSVVTMSTDTQKRIRDFLLEVEQLKEGVACKMGEEGGDALEDGGGREGEGQGEEEMERDREREAMSSEETWQEVRMCRYLRHRELPEQERELSLQEIFTREEKLDLD